MTRLTQLPHIFYCREDNELFFCPCMVSQESGVTTLFSRSGLTRVLRLMRFQTLCVCLELLGVSCNASAIMQDKKYKKHGMLMKH